MCISRMFFRSQVQLTSFSTRFSRPTILMNNIILFNFRSQPCITVCTTVIQNRTVTGTNRSRFAIFYSICYAFNAYQREARDIRGEKKSFVKLIRESHCSSRYKKCALYKQYITQCLNRARMLSIRRIIDMLSICENKFRLNLNIPEMTNRIIISSISFPTKRCSLMVYQAVNKACINTLGAFSRQLYRWLVGQMRTLRSE